MREETHLAVRVERLLVDEPGHPQGFYRHIKTYLCTPLSGEAHPGYEPEPEIAAEYALVDLRWLDLRDETTWGREVLSDEFLYPSLRLIRQALGFR